MRHREEYTIPDARVIVAQLFPPVVDHDQCTTGGKPEILMPCMRMIRCPVFGERSEKLWGAIMEYQVSEAGYSNRSTVASANTVSRNTSRNANCRLPLGMSMLCGDARHRENRAPDSEIIAGGIATQDVWFIRSGILRLQRYAYDGRRQILSLFLPGEIVGFEGEFREGVSVETVTQSKLCRIDRRKFDNMLNKNGELRVELFRQKQDQLDRLHWLTWSLGALSPEQRFCAFLALSTRIMPYHPLPDGTGVLSMQIPRADIADLLGTTVETICRINLRLSQAGVIEVKGPSSFRILDLKKLKSLGQIEAVFDKMTKGMSERCRLPGGLDDLTLDSPICFCGR